MTSDRELPGWARWLVVATYAWLGWGLDHDGETAAEFAVMIVVGSVYLVGLLCANWILQGPGQLDRGGDE
jgi:hypothetical protein